MLNLDLAGLSDLEIRDVIARRCSHCGSVEFISIYWPTLPEGSPFALVDMSCPEEVASVIREIGDFVFGRSALIKLAQAPMDSSNALPGVIERRAA